MIAKYYPKDKSKRLNHMFTVGDFYLDGAHPYILLDEELVAKITQICDHYAKRPHFPTKNSAFRTPASNRACGGARASKHLTGTAADFSIDGVSREELAKYAETLVKDRGGIGIYAGKNQHIHLDTRSSKMRWWIQTSNSNTPGFGGYPCTFKVGNRSPAISQIQRALDSKGFACGAADGVFGLKTEQALKAYQTSVQLAPDGAFGKNTNVKLGVFDW